MSLTFPMNHRENARNFLLARTNHFNPVSPLPAMAIGNAIRSGYTRANYFWQSTPTYPPRSSENFTDHLLKISVAQRT